MNAIDQTGKLERVLRFTDLAINAAAMPLPVDLIPTEVSQDDVTVNDAADSARTDDGPIQQGVLSQSDTQTQHTTAINQFVPDEAVLKSLEAAIDAVHDSLRPTAAATQHNSSQVLSETPHSDAAFTPFLPSTTQSIAPSEESVSASVAPQHAAANDHATAVTDELSDIAQPPISALSQPTALQDVAHTVQSVESTIENVTHAVTSTLSGLLGGNSADSGAVTIPSLGGLGLDALAGLLHPASPTPDFSHAAVPALASLQDTPVFEAIGSPEVVHADQELAHATHSPLHLAGSGLI